MESIITTKDREIQNLNGQIGDKRKSLDAIKSEYRREAAVLEGLQQQAAKVQALYIIIKTIMKNTSNS